MIAGLPYDAEVEYLQADGNAYLSIGLPILSGESIEFVMDNSDAVGIYGVFSDIAKSAWNDGKTFVSNGWSGNNNRIVYAASSVGAVGYFTGKMTVTIPGGNNVMASVTFNGNTHSEQTGGNRYDIGGFRIFYSPTTGNNIQISQSGFMVYSFKTESIDLIPVRVGTEGAMYDRVSRKLFRNAGTGAFTIGPDVATPVMGLHFMRRPKYTAKSYIRDGLISMWDGIENAGWGVHDANATTWKDLVGDNDITLTMGGGSWIQSGGLFIAKTPKTTGTFKRSVTTYKQIEVAGVELTSDLSYDRHILICFGPTHAFVIGQNRLGFIVAKDVVGIEPTYPESNNRANVPFSVSVSYTAEELPDPNGMYYNGDKKQQAGQSITLSDISPVFNRYTSYQSDANIYCIRLYSRALTAAEIAHNYAIDKERFNLP